MAAAVPQHLLLAILSLAVLRQVASAPPTHAYASSSSYNCGWCPRRSTASLLPPDAAALTGAACGYGASQTGAMATDIAKEGFHIAAVSAEFFRDGQACGACYQLRCTDRTACAAVDGVKIVVIAAGESTEKNMTGDRFLLTRDAFTAMTNRIAGTDDDATVDVDVDFRRIPCVYGEKNLSVKVEETSARDRGRLALRFLYQGGQTDIAAVEVAQAVADDDAAPPSPASMWRYMTRRDGSLAGVWRTSRAPAGPLRLRIVVTAGSGGKWLLSDGAALPAEWVPGEVYDTGLRVVDVAASICGGASCDGDDEDGDEEELR